MISTIIFKGKIHYAWWILVGCCAFIMSVLGIVNSCQGLFLIPVTESLGISRAQYSLAITIQGLLGIVSMPIAGRLLPKLNIRLVLTTALIFYIGSFSSLSLCKSIYPFFILSAVLGFSGGFLTYIPVAVLIGNWFKEKQGFALGIAMSFTGIGGAIFNPVGSILIQNYGWRLGYQLLGAMALIIALPVTLGIFRFSPIEKGLQPFGASTQDQDNNVRGVKAQVAFRSKAFVYVVIWSIVIGTLGGVMYHIPAFVNQLEYPAAFGGTVMAVFMLSMTIGKIVLGFLNDRFGSIAAIGIYSTFTTMGIFCFYTASASTLFILIGAALFGPGMALMLVETPILVRKIFGDIDYSAIYAIISMILNVMATVSVFIYGTVFDITQSYKPIFAVILLCPVLGFFTAVLAFKSCTKMNKI